MVAALYVITGNRSIYIAELKSGYNKDEVQAVAYLKANAPTTFVPFWN